MWLGWYDYGMSSWIDWKVESGGGRGVGKERICREEKGEGLQGVVTLGEGMYGVCGGGYWNLKIEIENRDMM